MMAIDVFGKFTIDTYDIVIIISSIIFIVSYTTFNAIDTNNKVGTFFLKFFSILSMILLILTMIKKFSPTPEFNLFEIMSQLFQYIASLITSFLQLIINFLEPIVNFFKNLYQLIRYPTITELIIMLIILIIISVLVILHYVFGIKLKLEDTHHNDAIQIIYSIFAFMMFLLISYFIIPKLYSSQTQPAYKITLAIAFGITIAMLLGGFYMSEISNGNYSNYGTLLFSILLFSAFIYIIFEINTLLDPSVSSAQSTLKYFLYLYLFPICFLIGYILYYIYVYKKEKLSYTDFTDYRVILFYGFSIIFGLYVIYQFVKKIKTTFGIIPSFFTTVVNFLMNHSIKIIGSLLFILFIYFVNNGTGSNGVDYGSWYMVLLEMMGIITLLSGIIKILLETTTLGENKIFQLLQKTILLLPCLFLIGLDNAFKGQKFGTASEFLFIVLVSFFLLFYNFFTTAIIPDLYEKYILIGGNQVIDKPIPLSEYTFVSSYDKLFNFDGDISTDEDTPTNISKYDYRYGLSFWFYLNSFPPLNSQLYDICHLGDGLIIRYNPVKNSLYFMYVGLKVTDDIKNDIKDDKKNNMKNKKSLTIENLENWNEQKNKVKTTEQLSKEIIIHKEKNILLQKWNNIIINYNGGTMDIFINGKLIKSKINVAPYIQNTALTVGSSDGIKGDICNLIYYKSPMSKTEIYRMYNIFKNKNPPTVNKKDADISTYSDTIDVYFSEWFSKIK